MFFINGLAGTGKSTLLQYFRLKTAKEVAVLAPTGVAGLNIFGQTIHSFFGSKPDITLDKVEKLNSGQARLYQALDSLIFDEISMVRADLLDCIDLFLKLNGRDRKKPFGHLQMIFIGDLYQLPPSVIFNFLFQKAVSLLTSSIFRKPRLASSKVEARIARAQLFFVGIKPSPLELEKYPRALLAHIPAHRELEAPDRSENMFFRGI